MAGTILISRGVGVPVSTLQFDYITERVRSEFGESERNFMEQIYSSMDEGGMAFISAESQGVEGFKIFLNAVQKAHRRAADTENYAIYQMLWEELERTILSDPRCSLSSNE